jgi:hypothetical protein
MDRKVFSDYRVALDTALIVGSIVAARGLLFALGIDGMSLSPLTSSIVAGGVFVMGLVVAGTLSDYKDADRAPADLATELYAILREEFLPSAFAMIVSIVAIILAVVTFTDFDGVAQSLVTVGFLSFFFIYLLRLLRVIDKPFKVGRERTDDDVSLFLLTEFAVHAQAGSEGVAADEVTEQAAEVEEYLADVEAEEQEA